VRKKKVAPKKVVRKKTVKKPVRKKVVAKKKIVRKKRVKVVPVISEIRAEESKYYTPKAEHQHFKEKKGFEFPSRYNECKIVAMVRDPYWIYCYWEVNFKPEGAVCLRINNVDNWEYFDIETGSADNWFINVPHSNTTYCIDLGYKTADGRFVLIARSNWVTTPLDRPSDVIDEKWTIPDWNKIYELSGGGKYGRSSADLSSPGKKFRR